MDTSNVNSMNTSTAPSTPPITSTSPTLSFTSLLLDNKPADDLIISHFLVPSPSPPSSPLPILIGSSSSGISLTTTTNQQPAKKCHHHHCNHSSLNFTCSRLNSTTAPSVVTSASQQQQQQQQRLHGIVSRHANPQQVRAHLRAQMGQDVYVAQLQQRRLLHAQQQQQVSSIDVQQQQQVPQQLLHIQPQQIPPPAQQQQPQQHQPARYMRVGPSNSVGGVGINDTAIHKGFGSLLGRRFLILDLYDGNSMHKCFDVKTKEEFVCKSVNNPCSNLLTAHFRLDGHPHINPLRKVIQTSKQTFVLFPTSEGDLHSYVRVRKRLKEPEARRLFRQMCETVKACHEQGIVLRDLKLRKFIFADSEKKHLLLESLEDAVVLDNPEEDVLQDKRGCPAYVSPEILIVNATYSGKAADMWSLGVILYTMLVGRYPFNDSEHSSLFAKISRGHFLIPDCLSSTARCIIRSLLRRDPSERITSDDILHHPWLLKDDSTTSDVRFYNNKSSSDQCVPEMYMDEEN